MNQLGMTVWTTYVTCGSVVSNRIQNESINNPWMIQNYVRSYQGNWPLIYDVPCPYPQTLTRYNYINHYWQASGGTYRNAEKWQVATLKWPTFYDVPTDHWAYSFIEPMYQMGIMDAAAVHDAQCPTAGFFCPTSRLSENPEKLPLGFARLPNLAIFSEFLPCFSLDCQIQASNSGGFFPLRQTASNVTRGEMAFYLERGIRGSDEVFPPANGTIFTDVPGSMVGAAVIEKLYADGITSGCGYRLYCPNSGVTRAQMAVFLLRAEHGSGYVPDPVDFTSFTDVPADYWAAAFIQQLYNEGVTVGCNATQYCPESYITRAEMAVFLLRIFAHAS